MKWPLGGPRAQARPDATVETLVLANLDSAHNLARWLVRDASLAEDVVQDAAVRALTYIKSYDGGDARAWLMRIVRNVAYDAIAARRRRDMATISASTFEDEGEPAIERVPDPADDPEAALSRRQDRAALDAALADLAIELRECLVLREFEALSYKDIAAVTGVPIGTVMSRLSRARRTLMENVAREASRQEVARG